MKPVFQTQFFDKEAGARGDCLRACLCSLFELPTETFPVYTRVYQYEDMFYSLGYEYTGCASSIDQLKNCPGINGLFIAWGETSREGRLHSVIINSKGELFHDPYPGGEGLTHLIGIHLIERL